MTLARVVSVVALALGLTLVVLFGRALPEAMERARVGKQRVTEAACDGLRPAPTNSALGTLPARAPDFVLKDYQGRELSLASLRGNVVLINFWATWCKTCVVEMPSMERLVAKMKGKPFRLIAISVDDDWPTVRNFFPTGTPLDIVLDPPRSVSARYGTEKFPETFLIDKEGMIRHYIISDRDWDRPDVTACLESMM